jgi:hypothetical protein
MLASEIKTTVSANASTMSLMPILSVRVLLQLCWTLIPDKLERHSS